MGYAYNPFDAQGKMDMKKRDSYWTYLSNGFVNFFGKKNDDLLSKDKKSFKAYAKDVIMPKLILADKLDGPDSNPRDYVKNQLTKSWNDDMALIVVVGHGSWYKDVV